MVPYVMKVDELSVLLIEDEKPWIDRLEIVLDEVGINRFDKATSEEQATEYFRNRRYDLVISDTMHGSNHPMGPNSIREAKKLGHKSVVVALSSIVENRRLWEDLADYFFDKGRWYPDFVNGLKTVFQEKFGI